MQFTPDFFINNRNRLTAAIDRPGIIVVPGNGLMQRSGDTQYPFRQNSNFYYLTGVNEPGATLVIDMVRGNTWLMLPLRQGIHAIFDGSVDIEKLRANSGIQDIVDEREGLQRLRLHNGDHFYLPKPPPIRIANAYSNPHQRRVRDALKRFHKQPFKNISPILTELRAIKSTEELAAIEQATTITYDTLRGIIDNMQMFTTEHQLETEVTHQFAERGAYGHAYQPIVASGINSCTLHYSINDKLLNSGDTLLFDVGAEVSSYAADISRTVVYGGSPSKRQHDVMRAVAEIQHALISELKPGMTFKELSLRSEQLTGVQLARLGLITNPNDRQTIRRFFPHAVTHFLGLDVHDAGDYTKPLAEGMVITIEPGIYITEESIGVRIEDDVVITKNGANIIGKALPALL